MYEADYLQAETENIMNYKKQTDFLQVETEGVMRNKAEGEGRQERYKAESAGRQ